jgi:CRP-like cAMP-binding protein
MVDGKEEISEGSDSYFIWGIDDAPYGPVTLTAVTDWIKDERVLPDTWIFARRSGTWQQATDVPELKKFFNQPAAVDSAASCRAGVTPGSLRRIKILADLNDAQLDHLLSYLELQRVSQWSTVVRQGEQGDAMYLVLAGELRARTMVGERETILGTFSAGDFFGDMSLFDHGPRSADVIANVDSTMLRISVTAFDRLTREAPVLATPFLRATARTLSARIRADNKRLHQLTQQFNASRG